MYNLEGKVQKNLSNNETNFIVPNNCVVVCPWVIRNGFQNIAEVGFLPANADPYWYGFFQKVFTGNQVITATWEDSTYLTKVADQYKFQYNFQVGKYYEGAVVVGTAEYSTEIEPMEGNEDFLAMKNNSSVTIRFQGWVPTEKDMYKLYTIPDLYGGKWYYISNVKVLNDLQSKLGFSEDYSFNDTSIPAVEVTFTSLVDKLQVSGKAVEQYVQYAGIGEPYVIPLVTQYNANYDSEEEDEQYIEPTKYVTYIPYQPQSANYLQVELQGANAFSAVEVEGRVLTWDSTNSVWVSSPWKRLLAHNVVANQVNELNRTSLPSRNFYYFPAESLDFVTSKTFQEDNKTREDALAMNQSAGKIKMGATADWTNKATGLHKSNPVTADGIHWDYNNQNWFPTSWYGQDWPHDTNGNFYAVNNISIKTTDNFVDILNKNSFIYETQPIIPLGFVSSKPYHISSIPIIGKIVSKFWGDMTINPNTTQRQPLSIGYFIDCDIAGMIANIYSSEQDNGVWAPLNALVGDETKASKYLGSSACNSTLCLALTDRISENGTEYNTIYFGQNKKEDGTTNILSDGSTYYYGRANQITLPKNESDVFVIDSVTVYALHKGKIKLTAFNTLSNPIWTTTVQSKANWTNSIRDWATTISTGGWSEDYCEFAISDFPWPKRPDKTIGTEIAINHNWTWPFSDMNGTKMIIYSWVGGRGWANDFNNETTYDNGKGAKAILPTQTTTITTSYSDLGVGISTKAQFKSYFKEMDLQVEGILGTSNLSTLKPTAILPITIGSADTYTETIIVGQLGDQVTGVTYRKLAVNDSQDAKEKLQQVLSPSPASDTGGFTQTITYTITLNESSMTITIAENDYLTSWRNRQLGDRNWGQFIRDRIDGTVVTPHIFWLMNKSATGKILSQVKVPKLSLIENEHTFELKGGSTQLATIVGVAGRDLNSWYAQYDGETISGGTFGLYNAPSGVTLQTQGNTCYIKWDSTLTTGIYDFYIYCEYNGEYTYKAIGLRVMEPTGTLTIEVDDPMDYHIYKQQAYPHKSFVVKLDGNDISQSMTNDNLSVTSTFVEGNDRYNWRAEMFIKLPCIQAYDNATSGGKYSTYNLTVNVNYGGLTATKTFVCKVTNDHLS